MFKIEKDIELPPQRWGRGHVKYPFEDLEIGDSFLVPCTEDEMKKIAKRLPVLYGRHKPKRFATRTMVDGVRCWRTE